MWILFNTPAEPIIKPTSVTGAGCSLYFDHVYRAALLAAQRKGGAKRPHSGKTHERARDRRGRETSQARNAGSRLWAGGACIRAPPRVGSSASAARWLRRTRPNAERRRLDTRGRPGTRVIRQGYPSIRRSETEADLRMRGWALDIHPPQPRLRRKLRPVFRPAIDAYQPDHPREGKPPKGGTPNNSVSGIGWHGSRMLPLL
jgi:hypothetical protein